MLAGLKAPLGVHAVMGNHDYWDDRTVQRSGQGVTVAHRALEAAGIPVYENDAVRLRRGIGERLRHARADVAGAPEDFFFEILPKYGKTSKNHSKNRKNQKKSELWTPHCRSQRLSVVACFFGFLTFSCT